MRISIEKIGKIFDKIICHSHCNALQGHFFLHGEVDSLFFIDSREKAHDLKLYKVKLDSDMVVEVDIGYGSEDSLIKKYAQIYDYQQIW